MALVVNTTNPNVASLRRCLSFGHRGYKGMKLENSLASLRAAIDAGVDGVEIDVHCCKTGELLVFHDHEVNRVTNGEGLVADKSFAELRELRLTNGEVIPTLAEALREINRACKINIELKGHFTAEPVAKLIQQFINNHGWEESDFIVTSFNHPEVFSFHTLMPKINFGPIVEGVPLGLASFAANMRATHLVINHHNAIPSLIKDAKDRGLKIFVYTVNNQDEINKMKKREVDAIISDNPDLVLGSLS